jgi:hypothetical protein
MVQGIPGVLMAGDSADGVMGFGAEIFSAIKLHQILFILHQY